MKHLLKSKAAIFFILFISLTSIVEAQVTTATMNGIVKDAKGTALASATVTVEYTDAGITQTLITKADGRFTVPNLRVGGPYKVTVNHVGFEQGVSEEIYLNLGPNSTIEFVMEEKTTVIGEVTVTSRSRIFDDKRTGASTNISNRLIRTLPSISRSADDYLRLTPSASANYNGVSFAGRNGQYNNFSLDGAVFNNPFGLDAPTPGGQANAQPISLDAIDQIQVNIAPYDVTQADFTGAGVNTVTKSGNNKIIGTAYVFYRNHTFTGKKIDGNKLTVPELNQLQAGAALGGPIIKNKLFYFLSFETEQRTDEVTAFTARNSSNATKSNTSRVLESDMNTVSSILKSTFNYDTGPYQNYTHDQTNYKWLTKLDWNISDVHKLSFTYNGLNARKDKPAHPSAIRRRGPDYTTLQFRNSGYEIVNKLHSFSTELKSNFKGNAANKLRLVYSIFRDNRNPFSTPFPVLNITKFGTQYIVAGHEPFSIHNILKQDAFQATNDFTLYKNNHTITIGASYESFKFQNSFNLTGYAATLFSDADIQTFIDSVPVGGNYVFGSYPLSVDVDYARNRAAADRWTWVYLTVGQLSGYVQDEIQMGERFRLTLGLRLDKALYSNERFLSPNFNLDGTYAGTDIDASPTLPNNDNQVLFDEDGNSVTNGVGKDLDNTRLPGGTLLSPRLGFNWDVKGNKTLQIRGGSGLFTGRFPFVWIGNHIGNPFTGFYNATDRNFRWPQVWRTNVGTDFRIPSGVTFSFDAAYTKDIKGMMVRNYNLGIPTGTLSSGTGDTRRIYLPGDKGTDGPFTTNNTYVFTNTKVGYQLNLTAQAQQTFKGGLYAMIAYNFLVAKDASSISAEISSDAFDRNPIISNANEARLTPSLYGNKHRVMGVVSKKYDYGMKKEFATTVSIFASWSSGNPFAFVYGGDLNNDGTATNDLLYVPTDSEVDAMQFVTLTDVDGNTQDATAQRAALKRYIAGDKYLSDMRGQYAEKYDAVTPGFSQIDMRVLQDFVLRNKNIIQFSLDVVNLGNLISNKWGVRKLATNSGYFQPIRALVSSGVAAYQFDPSLTTTSPASPDLISRWQLQFGLRYIF